MLLAGEDTTANTLAWMIWLLHRHPDAAQRVAEANPALILPSEVLKDNGAYAQVLWGIKPRIVAGLRTWIAAAPPGSRPESKKQHIDAGSAAAKMRSSRRQRKSGLRARRPLWEARLWTDYFGAATSAAWGAPFASSTEATNQPSEGCELCCGRCSVRVKVEDAPGLMPAKSPLERADA